MGFTEKVETYSQGMREAWHYLINGSFFSEISWTLERGNEVCIGSHPNRDQIASMLMTEPFYLQDGYQEINLTLCENCSFNFYIQFIFFANSILLSINVH